MKDFADILDALADDLTGRMAVARADMLAAKDLSRVGAYGGQALALADVAKALRSAALKAREQLG